MWNKVPFVDDLAQKAVASVFEHVKSDFEITIFDNHSPVCGPWIADCVAKGRVTVLKSSHNVGFGPAVNAAAQISRSEYVCQMNSDCELVEDSITMLVEAMQKHQIDVGMPEHYENCQHYGLGKTDQVMGPKWRFGALWVMKRELFIEARGFDPMFKMCYWEDTDLWKRIEVIHKKRIAGWRGTWVKHFGGASSIPERDEFFEKNRRLFEKRWDPNYREPLH